MDINEMNKSIRNISTANSLPILLYIILSQLMGIVAVVAMKLVPEVDYYIAQLGLYAVLYLMLFPLCIWFFFKQNRGVSVDFKSCFAKPQRSPLWIAKWIVISLALIYISNYISSIAVVIFDSFGLNISTAQIDLGDKSWEVVATSLFPIVFAPLFEELMFRGAIFRNCQPMGQWFAIFVSAVMFGLWHMNGVQTVYTMVYGALAAFLVVKTQSVIPSMILHFILNLEGVASYLLLSEFSDVYSVVEAIIQNPLTVALILIVALLVLTVIIVGFVLFAIELVRNGRKITTDIGCFNLITSKKLKAYFSSPITIITFVILVLFTIINSVL